MKKLIKNLTKGMTLFKIILIVLGVIFISKLNDMSKNGRYLPFDKYNIIDTHTGYIYDIDDYDLEYHSFPDK
jgi:hypothetical protein